METAKLQKKKFSTPFNVYYRHLKEIDKGTEVTEEFGSMLILTLIEELGEMSRAYLAKHGRKPINLAAQRDETYEQELGDIIVAILRFAQIKDIDLHKRIMYTIGKIRRRKKNPKV